METLVYGPADFMASINMKAFLTVGEQPQGYDVGDAYHSADAHPSCRPAARDLQAIKSGPT